MRGLLTLSAGRRDAFTFCVGHYEEDQFVCDAIWGRHPPFDCAGVAKDFVALAKSYNCRTITHDHYSGGSVAQAFRDAGMTSRPSDLSKSLLYLEGLQLFMRGLVSIPDCPQLIRELRLLERRTSRSGKDCVDHGVGGSDDYANVLFGAMRMMTKRKPREHRAVTVGPRATLIFSKGNMATADLPDISFSEVRTTQTTNRREGTKPMKTYGRTRNGSRPSSRIRQGSNANPGAASARAPLTGTRKE